MRYVYYEHKNSGVVVTSGVFRFNDEMEHAEFKYILDEHLQSTVYPENKWVQSWEVDKVLLKLENHVEPGYKYKELSEKEAFLLLI